MIIIRLKKGETVDRALKRMKKILDKEGIMKQIRANRYFEKPSEKKRKKAARSRRLFFTLFIVFPYRPDDTCSDIRCTVSRGHLQGRGAELSDTQDVVGDSIDVEWSGM